MLVEWLNLGKPRMSSEPPAAGPPENAPENAGPAVQAGLAENAAASAETKSRIRSALAGQRSVVTEAMDLYRDLHANPELSGAEHRTAVRLAGWLERDGLRVTTGIGGHGVAALLDNGSGPLVMLRAELDALPIAEETELPYRSTATGVDADGNAVPVMHACGHDLHAAAVAGAARLLAQARGQWRGRLLIVGQPAEETLVGARAMVDDGLFRRFGTPDVALAQHTAPLLAGMVAHSAGPITACASTLEVVIHGRGGHAASAQLGIDPIIAAAATVLRLQTIVSREVPAAEQVALHVGSVRAGSRGNIMPEQATLELTLRALSESTLERLHRAVERIVRAESAASGCVRAPEIRELSRSPVNVNDAAATAVTRAAHQVLLGPTRVAAWPPSLATEDFAHYAESGAATVYWMLGSVGPEQWNAAGEHPAGERLRAVPAHHSPRFAPDAARTLPIGIAAMVAGALAHLPPP
jgi:amidohydrolase